MAVAQKVKLKVIELRAEGLSYSKIAEALQISKQTAVDITKENIDQVETLQAIEAEALFEEKRVNLRGRIEQLSAIHSRLREEIESRDLSVVPTDKLIALFIKISDTLKGEVYSPSIYSTSEQDENERKRNFLNW